MLRRVMMAAATAVGWITTYFKTHDDKSSGWGGYTLRVRIPASDLLPGQKIRLTFHTPAGAAAAVINSAFIGKLRTPSASGLDFASAPTQILFSGQAGVTVPAGGRVTSDPIALPIQSGDSIVISALFASGDIGTVSGSAGWVKGDKFGDSAQEELAIGYGSLYSDYAYLVEKIEVLQ